MMEEKQSDTWSVYLPEDQYIMNTQLNSITKSTPYKIVFGILFYKKLDLITKREEINRNKMSLKHNSKRNKKTASFKIGDFVTIMIQREDRGHSDLYRIPGQVFAKNGGNGSHETYSIVTAYGKLSEKYPVKCLSIYEGTIK